jgi:hypothetical protein
MTPPNDRFAQGRLTALGTILPANITGRKFSKMDDSNRELAISVEPRQLTYSSD